ncbi:MAG: branched-chain amino acid ABC transporter permease [Deltaproteobacteria bacterium]|jgi:branched-chain amino acid transport system permease protein|nr:branched-chain amino acid ABC transporter permease [Deltaproteobacteria bacterium]
MKTRKGVLIAVVLAAVFLLFPFFAPKFQLRMVTEIIILTLFAMTWKMMLNEGGMFSFGHAVYFGLGAYASVLGWLHIPGLSFLSGILLGALISALVAFILGAFLVRMSGTYFALLTLAFNQLIWAIVWKWRDVTGGDDGLGKFPKPDLFGLTMKNPVTFYYVALIITGACLYFCWYFTKTPMGNVALSIKSNEERAKFVGFNVQSTKLIFLTMLGFLAGISGALYAQFQEFIATSVIDLGMSTNVLFMAYIGGTGYFWGPLVGSGIFVYLSEYLSSFTDRWELILGLIFIAIVLFAPQGIMGLIRKKS